MRVTLPQPVPPTKIDSGQKQQQKQQQQEQLQPQAIEHKHFVRLVDGPSSPPSLKSAVEQAFQGFMKQLSPVLCEEGVGGTYFLQDETNKIIGIFKPQDEEPFNVNNPKGYTSNNNSERFKEGIGIGEASIRECAAYLLDHDHFAGVPATDLVICSHPAFFVNNNESHNENPQPKLGSFQEFKKNCGGTEDLGLNFIASFPTDEVHKIAVLDIRIFNTDRHGDNILFNKEIDPNTGRETVTLIPIDHGYSLPSSLDEAWFAWQTWPQVKEKFSPATKDYIFKIDVEKDIKMLQAKFPQNFKEAHFRVLRIADMLLKKAASLDLTPFEISNIMCRLDLSAPSELERWVARAEEESKDGENVLQTLSNIMDENLLVKSMEDIHFQ